MIQTYFLSLFYLLSIALLFISNSYKDKLVLFQKFGSILLEKKYYLNAYCLIGFIIGFLTLFFPISPGPTILGDLIPSLAIIISTFALRYGSFLRLNNSDRNNKKYKKFAIVLSLVIFLHFIFPSLVLL